MAPVNKNKMTKTELINKLAPYPDNMEVCLGERRTEFAYGHIYSVVSKKINFMEEPEGKVLARDTVIILTD